MRELIQSSLKIMARTGLFLSVLAWVVSQWWTYRFSYDTWFPTSHIAVVLSSGGYGITGNSLYRVISPGGKWFHDVCPSDELSPGTGLHLDVRDFDGVVNDYDVDGEESVSFYWCRRIDGNTIGKMKPSIWGPSMLLIGIRHCLIVSAFTIFNLALWWFYRKPKEVTPCES